MFTALVFKQYLLKCFVLFRQLLTNQELDTIKLMFSLMDTDGSLELNSVKVSQFILNILGKCCSFYYSLQGLSN